MPTIEAVEAVNVVTNSFEAETGLAGVAAIYVQTKSVPIACAFEDHDNQHLNARPFFLPASQSKPKFVYNDFGGALGGPIIKDKCDGGEPDSQRHHQHGERRKPGRTQDRS